MAGETPNRRDVLGLVTKCVGAVGIGYAGVTFFSAMGTGPDAEDNRVAFDLDLLRPGEPQTVRYLGKPYAFYLRTAEDIARSRSADPATFRDRLARNANLPGDAPNTDENRSISFDPRIVVFEQVCSLEECVLIFERNDPSDGNRWSCPCCGSRYDTEGRPYEQKATQNTRIPAYEQVGATVIRLGVRGG